MCIFFKAPIKFGWETSLQMCTSVGNGPSETKGKDSIWGSSGWGLLDDQRKLGSSFRVTDNYICETGKWWLREAVTLGSGWLREAVTLDWYYIAWKTHNLKMALRVYDALQNSRLLSMQTNYHDRGLQEHWFGLCFKYALCPLCFHALATVCTAQDTALHGTDSWQCHRGGDLVECSLNRGRASSVRIRCILGPQCLCGWWGVLDWSA